MKSLFWLASYPKSGNTWLRAFLANYVFNLDQPVPINQIGKLGIGDANTLAHARAVQRRFNPTSPRDTLKARKEMLDIIDSNGADLNFVKTHNQNAKAMGVDLIPQHQTRGAIYIVRDPRDMAISYASHHGMTLDEVVVRLNRKDNATAGNERNVHQFLGTWSDHVRSWTETRGFPVCTLRYEDMLADAKTAFSAALKQAGIPLEEERLRKAIRFSSFDELSAQENKNGFVENSEHQQSFFRTGRSGGWRDELTPEQIEKIETDHARYMRKFGYLD